jgi:hypothetical protein
MPLSRITLGEDLAIHMYCNQLGDVIQKVRIPGSVPPDSIIERKNKVYEWVEVTSVWKGMHKNEHVSFAKAMNSPTSNGEIFEHEYTNDYWKNLEIDLIHSIRKKDSKLSYQPFLEKYGKGILILNLEDPYYGTAEISEIYLPKEFGCKQLVHFQSVFVHLSPIHEWYDGSLHSCPSRLIPVLLK